MTDPTAALRQRRHRAHKRGDHSLCDPARDCVTSPVTGVTRNAETRGLRLWREMDGDSRTGGERALLEEACRIADRLDRLDAILDGDPGEWMRFQVSEDGAEVVVTLDKALAEARQQAAVLKQIVAELRQGGAAPVGVGRPRGRAADAEQQQTGGGDVIGLAAEAAKRRPRSAG